MTEHKSSISHGYLSFVAYLCSYAYERMRITPADHWQCYSHTASTDMRVTNKSVSGYLRTLTTWHCPQSPAAIHCCSSRSISPAHRAHSSKPAADRSTDIVGYYFIIDHAPHAANADKLTECSSSTEDAVAAADGWVGIVVCIVQRPRERFDYLFNVGS